MPAFFSSRGIVRDGRCSFAGELSAPPQNCVWIPGAQDRFKLGDPLNSLRRWEIFGGCLAASLDDWGISGRCFEILFHELRSGQDHLNERDGKAVPPGEGGRAAAGRGLVNQRQASNLNEDLAAILPHRGLTRMQTPLPSRLRRGTNTYGDDFSDPLYLER